MSTAAIDSSAEAMISFEDLIAPMTAAEFLRTYWQQLPCHIPGRADKFSHLFSWAELNEILQTRSYDYPRLKLFKNGAEVPASEYWNNVPFSKRSRLKADSFRQQFSSGATMILLHVDEFSPTLRSLAAALQNGLGWPVEVEVIAGSGSSNGLPLHIDGNDCVVFQITGSKQWQFFAPTRVMPLRKSKFYPDRHDVAFAKTPASESPLFSYEVKAGDFMYIPRGWWHMVTPNPGPCLSVNPSVYTPSFQDFLHWLTNELSSSQIFRRGIPFDEAEQLRDLQSAQDVLARNLTPAMVEQYRRFWIGELGTLPRVDLLGSGSGSRSLSPASRIKLSAGEPLYAACDPDSSTFRIRWCGKNLLYRQIHHSAFMYLNDTKAHAISELLTLYRQPESHAEALRFIAELLDLGILSFD